MKLKYINENLTKVIENPESVMYIKPYVVGDNKALFAVIKEDEGIYKKIQLTKFQSIYSFPIEPFYYFLPAYYFLKDFTIYDNLAAFNINFFDGFKSKLLTNNTYNNLGIFATFNDGSATFISEDNDTTFQYKGGIKKYENLLEPRVPINQTHDTYEIIESYGNDENDTFVIPCLKNKEKKEKRKILIRKDSSQV